MEYEEAKFLLDSKIVLEESKARREKREMVVFGKRKIIRLG